VGGFDTPAVDLLEAGNERQQHRLGLLRAGAKNQQRRQIVFDDGFGLADLDLLALRRYPPERLRYSVRVNDHDYRAVAKNGRAGKDREMPQLRGERLDHDFFGVEYAVDHNAEDLAADLGDDDEASLVPARPELQQLLELNERQELVAQPQHRSVFDPLRVMLPAIGRAHQFQDGELRNRKPLGAGFDNERGDDRQRQRNLDRER